MAERFGWARPRISWRTDGLLIVLLTFVSSFVALTPNDSFRGVRAAPMSLTFESTTAGAVSLGTLASRSQCGVLTKQGVGPYTMTGTDSRSGAQYSYVTNTNYAGAGLRESGIGTPSGVTYSRTPGQTYSGKSNVLMLTSSGSVTWANSCNGATVYGSIFGPEVYTAAFEATAGQALSFNWAAAGGGDDYEVYAFLVKVSYNGSTYDYGGTGTTLAANTTLLAHSRGTSQAWTTSTGSIPSDGFYRFRFVNGSYDASGGKVLGANMYIDPNVLVGQANNISFGTLSDRVTSSSAQTFTISASATSGGAVTFTSSTTGRCTVGASTTTGGVSSATVTLLASQTGLCTITADSASTGDFATAASVARSFTILAAPTAPTNSGGTAVTGTASVGSTLTASEGSWADGGSAITGTSFQWQVCPNPASCVWTDVTGADSSTYLLGSSDVGKQFRVRVSKTNSIGTTSATSSATSSVAKGTQTALTITDTSVAYGSTLTLTTSGGSGSGAVSYSVVSGTCTLAGNVLTPGAVGSSCVVKATKASDASFNEISSSNTTISVAKASQAVLSVTSTSGTFGVGLTLTSSGGSGTGAISYSVVSGSCSVSGTTLTASSAGSSCVVKATKASDTNYNEISSSNTTVTFAKGSQAPLTISSVSAVFGIALNLATSGGSGTGAVTYSVSSGSCSVLGSILTVGDAGSTCEVIATKAGDDDYNPVSSAATSISTAKATQAVLTVTSTNATYGRPLALTSSGGSGNGAVTFAVVSGTCSISGSSLTPGNAGSSCVVKATKGTDTNYNERSSANTTITIAKANQTGLNVTSSSSFTTGSTLALTASGGQSTGALSWSLQSGSCSLTGSNLTAPRGGITCIVEVTRAGDSNYFADSITDTITVTKISQVLTFRSTPPSNPVVGGTYTVNVDSDVSLAPSIVIANSSSAVCSISAGVVTFNAVGTCLISASQAGSDVYAPAAASQSVSVGAAPVTTTTIAASGAQVPSTTAPAVTTTLPQSAVAAVSTATTVPTPTTTTTTTTTLPPDPTKPILGANGQPVELAEGETTVLIRGEEVVVNTKQEDGQLVMELPNNVVVRIGAKTGDGTSLQVSPDGVLRAFRNSEVAVELTGLVPGTTYTIYMFSTPIELGRGEVSADGAVSQFVKLPSAAELGSHTLQVNGVGPGGEVVSVSLGIKVEKKQSNTVAAVTAISAAILLALLGGRPIFSRRRRRRSA